MKSKNKKKKDKKEDNDSDKSDSDEEKTQKTVMISTPHAKFQGLIRHVLLILSVINALKRRPRSRYYDEGTTSVAGQSSKKQPDKKVEMAENIKPCSAPEQTQEEGKKDRSEEDINPKLDSHAESKPALDNGNLPFVGCSSLGVSSVLNENITTKAQSFLGGKNQNPSANGTTMNEQENTTGNNTAGKIESVIRNSSKRQLAAMILPCFTFFTSNDHDDETEQDGPQARYCTECFVFVY